MYDTANRLADDADRQHKVTIQNIRDVLETAGHHQSKVQIKYIFAPILFCEESQRNVAESLLHPVQGTHAPEFISRPVNAFVNFVSR